MGRIAMNDYLGDAVRKMCDGNPGGLRVLIEVLEKSGDIDPDNSMAGLGYLLLMDEWGIYGSHIWLLYKDICGTSLNRMLGVLRATQLGILPRGELKAAITAAERGPPLPLDVSGILELLRKQLPRFVTDEEQRKD